MTRNTPSSTCCFCCHVKTGTFMLAVLTGVAGLITLVFCTLALSGSIEVQYDLGSAKMFNDLYENESYRHSALWIGVGNGVFITLISGLAVFGLIKNRSGFLLPFFICQLFNFLCTIVYIGSVMFYWPSIKANLLRCPQMPQEWKDWLMSVDERWLACIVFTILFIIMVIKSYLIAVVYRCYKHITTQQVILRQRQDPEIMCVSNNKEKSCPIYKPPKYEDIQKVPLFDDMEEIDTKPAPPPYAA
nr:lysosomal-associated transmembrane protein 4A [Ciona intestinalis]|eukprot:XP_009861540.1 lysosomal-associated transmembrane protein 4A [Ciona intestinalis]